MEDKKFSGLSLTVIALLLMVLVGTGVYAYYASQATGTTTLRSLKYAFQVKDTETANVENAEFTITLTSNELQPGTQVAVPVKLSNTDSEVPVDYTLSVRYADGSATIENLSLCLVDSANGECADPLSLGSTSTQAYAGTIAVGDAALTKTFYLTWPYGDETSAVADTRDMNKTVNLTIEVTGQQHNPNVPLS